MNAVDSSTNTPDQADRVLIQQSERRDRSRAAALPLIGFFLLTPLFIRVFAAETTVLGAPLVVVYIFGIWLGLIVCAALLAKRLKRADHALR